MIRWRSNRITRRARSPASERRTYAIRLTVRVTEAEANRLLDAATGMRLEALYNLAVVLGLRQGELLGLSWDDVDLPRAALRVRQQFQQPNRGKPFLKPLKTRGSRRDLDLTADLVRLLQAHRDRQRLEQHAAGRGWNAGNLMFPSNVGTPMYARNLITHYKRLLTRADLPDRRFHNLRHTAATIMFARGMSESEVRRVLGHSSIAITTTPICTGSRPPRSASPKLWVVSVPRHPPRLIDEGAA